MTTLNISTLPTTKTTYDLIANFIYENKATLSNDMKYFYSMVRDMVFRELYKKTKNRATTADLLERAYNIDELILASGACSIETEFINSSN